MPLYAFRFSQEYLSFRVPSILSIAQVFDFPIKFINEELDKSILVIELEKEEDARRILERGTLVKCVTALSSTPCDSKFISFGWHLTLDAEITVISGI